VAAEYLHDYSSPGQSSSHRAIGAKRLRIDRLQLRLMPEGELLRLHSSGSPPSRRRATKYFSPAIDEFYPFGGN
jgi:hypothetical protein